jgi:hypothetical protein
MPRSTTRVPLLQAGRVQQQEANIAAAKIDAENPNINLPALLNSEFPLHRHSCNYPSACDYQGLCHPVANELGMSQLGEQLLQATSLVQLHGLGFKLRTPNHPEPKAVDNQA